MRWAKKKKAKEHFAFQSLSQWRLEKGRLEFAEPLTFVKMNLSTWHYIMFSIHFKHKRSQKFQKPMEKLFVLFCFNWVDAQLYSLLIHVSLNQLFSFLHRVLWSIRLENIKWRHFENGLAGFLNFRNIFQKWGVRICIVNLFYDE